MKLNNTAKSELVYKVLLIIICPLSIHFHDETLCIPLLQQMLGINVIFSIYFSPGSDWTEGPRWPTGSFGKLKACQKLLEM